MVYCRECGEQVNDSDVYCWSCGTHLTGNTNDRSIEERADEFWNHIEKMIDREIERIQNSQDLAVPPPLLNRYSFAVQMYIIGNIKGTVGTILMCAVDDAEDTDPSKVDLSPIYERIVESVQDREDEICDALKQPDEPSDIDPST